MNFVPLRFFLFGAAFSGAGSLVAGIVEAGSLKSVSLRLVPWRLVSLEPGTGDRGGDATFTTCFFAFGLGRGGVGDVSSSSAITLLEYIGQGETVYLGLHPLFGVSWVEVFHFQSRRTR
jgi:hypothetical protein